MPLPLIIAASVAGASVAANTVNRLRQKKLSISIIGPAAAGKSVLIDILKTGKIPETKEYQGTVGMQKLKEFEAYWTQGNLFLGTYITVNSRSSEFRNGVKNFFPDWIVENSGTDVPGDYAYVEEYKVLVKDKDAVFFVFDASKYLEDSEYQNLVKSEFMLIYESSNNGKDINFILLGSHVDVAKSKTKLATEKMVSDKFLATLTGREYRSMVAKNIRFLNFMDQKSVEEIRKSLGSLGE